MIRRSRPRAIDVEDLWVANLRTGGIPPELLSQYLPVPGPLVAAEALESDPLALMRDKVREVLDDHLAAGDRRSRWYGRTSYRGCSIP